MKLSHETIVQSGPYSEVSIEGFDKETVLKLYEFMVRLRRCEEALMEEYHPADEIRCPVHFTVGQESVSAGLSQILKESDYMFSHHRLHGYFLAKKAPMRALFAEMYGRETGANGGKAGSQDISMSSVNFFGGAIVAGTVGIAVGTAMGLKIKGSSSIAVTGFGEGAADEGAFWEAVNYAVLSRLPVLFVCENNQYATFSPQHKRQAKDNLSARVGAFGVETHSIFGNDATAVYDTLACAAEKVRSGKGPIFIEAYTYRWNGHVGPEGDDDVGYRPAAELEYWKQNCPIHLLGKKMYEAGLITDEILDIMLEKIDAEIADAFAFAKSSPFPDVEDWERMNYSPNDSLADRLLLDAKPVDFDQYQEFAIPKPY